MKRKPMKRTRARRSLPDVAKDIGVGGVITAFSFGAAIAIKDGHGDPPIHVYSPLPTIQVVYAVTTTTTPTAVALTGVSATGATGTLTPSHG